ncbi:MAG: molecular chaperone HtpG [Bacteroidia bacterium]
MKTGTLNVHTENIFPIIKKFLYSDEEIFLRELVSNAQDATKKVETIARKGDLTEELGELKLKVTIDKENRTITVSDRGIGMTEEELDKYLNQIALSSAEEFVEKYKDVEDRKQIIGKFGLGFYSAFMVSDKVEVQTKSWQKDAKPAVWECEGDTNFKIKRGTRKERGTDVILHINKDSDEYLEPARIKTLLEKYCRFMPFEIEFEGEVINNPNPIWLKQPADLTAQDYQDFYKELYPFSQPPLFWIHLNVDYPFRLTGILYFPKITNQIELQQNKIQLYQNQVFVTDEVKDIVPEFLTLLHGVIDSPDIPLNVSRSYLQADRSVKQISNYIVKKVAEKLEEQFKNEREAYESKWQDINMFVKYGMLSDDKFRERAEKFMLVENTDGKRFTIEEYNEKVKPLQTDKEGNTVWLYTNNPDEQHGYIDAAQKKDFDVLVLREMIDNHGVQMLESNQEKLNIKRVDADTPDKLIDKGEEKQSVLSEEQISKVKALFEEVVNGSPSPALPLGEGEKAGEEKVSPQRGDLEGGMFAVETEAMSPEEPPLVITRDEFMRRMSDMSKLGGGMMMGNFPEKYNLKINTNHPLAKKLSEAGLVDAKGSETASADKKALAKQAFDLARLSQNMLKGKELTEFVQRSINSL